MVASEVCPYLDLFCRRHPQLFLHIYDENSFRIQSGLKTGKVDISFVICRKKDFEDIPGRVLLSYFSNLYLHLPVDHELANEKEVHFSLTCLFPSKKASACGIGEEPSRCF